MDKQPSQPARKPFLWPVVLRGLFLYVLVPGLLIAALAQPAGNAVRNSDAAAFLILFAALAAVGLNWLVYKVIHKKHPPILVFAHGVFCLLAVAAIEHEALPADCRLVSTLAMIMGPLVMIFLLLVSSWLASFRRCKPALSAAVLLRIIVGLILFLMAYQIFRDIESGCVSLDTVLTFLILVAMIPVSFLPKIISSYRRRVLRSRAAGLAEGTIVQIIGETHLDRDDDPVTLYHARIEFTAEDISYETRADISPYAIRKFGRDAFIGKTVPVSYDPADPHRAYTDKIDRHFFDTPDEEQDQPET